MWKIDRGQQASIFIVQFLIHFIEDKKQEKENEHNLDINIE